MRGLAFWLGLSLGAAAAVPPSEPANPMNRDGFWVGQSEPGVPVRCTRIALTAGPQATLRGDVTLSEADGPRATVVVEWITPDRARQREVQIADRAGVAHFSRSAAAGRWRLEILQVLKARFRFDRARSEVSAAIAPEDAQQRGGV